MNRGYSCPRQHPRSAALRITLVTVFLAAIAFAPNGWAAENKARSKPGGDKEAWAMIDAGRRTKDAKEAAKLFSNAEEHARDVGDTWAEAAAVNWRALLSAREGETKQAISLLTRLPISNDDPEGFVFKYNLGRVLQQANDSAGAMKAYETSLALQPEFDAPRDRLYDLFLKGKPNIPRALWAGDLLVRHGQASLVADRLLDLLERWGTDPDAPRLFVQLARVYAAGEWDARRFIADDEPRVRNVGEKHPALEMLADQLVNAFRADVPGDLSAWKQLEGGATAMSRLLVSLAERDLCDDPPRLTAAAARYEAACRIDLENTDAPVAYASLLGTYSKDIDPTGDKLRAFVATMINEKTKYYVRPPRTRADWLNLLRFHTILATLFDQHPSFASQGTIYTSVYHWTRATEVQETIRKEVDPAFPLSARLYVGLAHAQYRDPRLAQEAWNSYVRAAVLCGPNDKSIGQSALTSAREVASKLQLDATQVTRFEQASTYVASLPGRGGRSDAATQPGLRWLPSEYRNANLPPEQTKKLVEENEKYEKQIRQTPLKSDQIRKERTAELDRLLDADQRDKVSKARTQRSAQQAR